jgi:hypothetical protein
MRTTPDTGSVDPTQVSAFRNSLIVNGKPLGGPEGASRYVIYQYCISIVILTFRRSSGIKVIEPGKSAAVAGLPYTLLSLVAGWWGIPWGPIYTVQSVYRNLRGGIDVTDLVVEAMAAEASAAAPAVAG